MGRMALIGIALAAIVACGGVSQVSGAGVTHARDGSQHVLACGGGVMIGGGC